VTDVAATRALEADRGLGGAAARHFGWNPMHGFTEMIDSSWKATSPIHASSSR
jgi:hypothetical protein